MTPAARKRVEEAAIAFCRNRQFDLVTMPRDCFAGGYEAAAREAVRFIREKLANEEDQELWAILAEHMGIEEKKT
jgi:hypothetical protein